MRQDWHGSGEMKPLDVRGFKIYKSFLPRAIQSQIVTDLRCLAEQAPMFRLKTRFGKQMSVRMTSAGRFGWYSDAAGYRYIDRHPNGSAWPAIPDSVLQIWRQLGDNARAPDCCLINHYDATARMGLHQDKDEADFSYPVVSISLGDEGLFRIGNIEKGGKTESIWLASGDVVVMGGDARLAHHGVDRIKAGSSSLLTKGGRINLTLRVVD